MSAVKVEQSYGLNVYTNYTESNQSSSNQVSSDNNNSSDASISPSPALSQNSANQQQKPAASYTRNRVRNNEAAKISRRNRRLREAEMAMRAAQLEQENVMLRAEISTLTTEIAALRQMATANALLPPSAHAVHNPYQTAIISQPTGHMATNVWNNNLEGYQYYGTTL